MRGYYRYPAISGDRIAFVAEDDVWVLEGEKVRRLTTEPAAASHPFFSPDGKHIAFTGREEGNPEVYVMDSDGGPARRLTYLGGNTMTVGWLGDRIVFVSDAHEPFEVMLWSYTVDLEGNVERLPYGPARSLSFSASKVALWRAGYRPDPAVWKGYRGGETGEIWMKNGANRFRKLPLKGNVAWPMIIGQRLYFVSDEDGIANLYSCAFDGSDVRKHTEHRDFYVRDASTDGERIVYRCGCDIYSYDPEDGEKKIEFEYAAPQIQRTRRFIDAKKFLEDYDLSPDGNSLALIDRGRPFMMGNWEGGVLQIGVEDGVRYRLARWLDEDRMIVVSDEGEEHLEIYDKRGKLVKRIDADTGRAYEIKVSHGKAAISNHRNEILVVDLETSDVKVVDRSDYTAGGFDWSSDGRYLAYSLALSAEKSIIKIFDAQEGKGYEVTEGLRDLSPCFDPEGKYLYFISARFFNPVADAIHHDWSFPKGMRPCLLTLRKEIPSPFSVSEEVKEEKEVEKEVRIDFEGIKDRTVPFPVEDGVYLSGGYYGSPERGVGAIPQRVFYISYPVKGMLDENLLGEMGKGQLKAYDMRERKEFTIGEASSFKVSGSMIAYRIGNDLRVVSAKTDPKQELPKEKEPSKDTGWIDLSRIKVSVDPIEEWRQMFRETIELNRCYFWQELDESMLKRYQPLLDRVVSRSELSDLLWEVQGELRTSHAYEIGGEYRESPQYPIGFLGAEFEWDEDREGYRIKRMLRKGDECHHPPLLSPGAQIEEGTVILAIAGKRLTEDFTPQMALVNHADEEVGILLDDGRMVTVKTLKSEKPLRYREWIERNRELVHKASGGRIGYIHVPDTSAGGYAEFHRGFLEEYDREGLVVDFRFNRGGDIPSLFLEKMMQRRLGYMHTKWTKPVANPIESPRGPMVAITNEYAGSGGDYISYAFRRLGLGKLIGKRTWGGLVGISPKFRLVDGTIVTQPEFGLWFDDIGYGIENHGVEPDIEVEMGPDEEKDLQMESALEELKKIMKG
jgi:tricorn protease